MFYSLPDEDPMGSKHCPNILMKYIYMYSIFVNRTIFATVATSRGA